MIFYLVNTTTSNKENAVKIAKHLIENKLAACVNIVPNVTSIYRWDGNICEEQEFLLNIKTKEELFKKVNEAIISKHEYELPEIIAVKIENGSDAYLKWIETETI